MSLILVGRRFWRNCILVTSLVCVQKSKAETDACKGQMAQLEVRIAGDRQDKESEMEALAMKLLQKTEVSCIIVLQCYFNTI